MRVNAEQASKRATWEPTRRKNGEGRRHWGTGGRTPAKRYEPVVPPGYLATACLYTEIRRNTGSPRWCGSDPQPEAREGQIGPLGVADGSVRPTKPGNAGGGKGPEFKESVRRGMRAGRVANAYDLRERFRDSGRRSASRPPPQSWACFLVREPGAGNPPAGFDERGVETEHGQTLRHRPSKEPATDYAGPKPPRHIPTLPYLEKLSRPTTS